MRRLHLSAKGAPGGVVGAGRLLGRGSSTQHDAAGEDSGLATVVVGDCVLGCVDENPGLPCPLATRELVASLFVIRGGNCGTRAERVGAVVGENGEA